jgi:hypothetical protein
MLEVVLLTVIVLIWCVGAIPAYVIARRHRLAWPWVAFVPIFGFWRVLLRITGNSGWLALLVLIPTLGVLVLTIWMAIEVPNHDKRTKWWTAALIVPLVNLVGYWAYAFTLSNHPRDARTA